MKMALIISLVLLGIVTAVFGVVSFYLTFYDAPWALKAFHGLHVLIVLFGFTTSYFAYKQYGHLLK